ncbi:uncharacterized protein LOC116403911 [Cucumis sativus]|uniref:uncharacterized protein LOC116403911 n=1 Tax=Cucumis sativus TaxID=3659 RepID=UPI0012F4CAC9|nr:uncharacterized protein LOC116403911 [Cucumis sativus]
MDKSWMHKSRLSKDYELGVENFIKFGFSNTTSSYIRYPCLKCGIVKNIVERVRDHLYVNGIDESYKIWFWHGEELPNSSFYDESSKFDIHTCEDQDVGSVKEIIEVAHEEYSKDPTGFEKLLIDAEKPLYEGCKKWKNVKDTNERRKQIPSKVIWYFPIIPRFKRLFRSIECAENLTWHSTKRINDGKLRHPADSPAWKLVDMKWPDFGSEPRNLRLALSADGVNPHGPKQPGDDIDIYLSPLIEALKLLWESGVECYDAYREEPFNLRSVLLWTINDFPAYGNLSRCCVKGYKACPICGDNTNSIRLKYGKKMAYLGHRRFLARNHPYRRQKKSFNGKKELDTIPEPLSGEDVYLKLKDLEFSRGKKNHKKRLMNRSDKICCTLLDIPGKSKDGLNVRRDLVDLKLRPELAPISSEKKIFIPPACYTLTKDEKRCVLKTLSGIKVPEGYSSNIRNLVSMTDLKLNRLKSHDCPVLIQQLFPIAIRSVLPKHVRYAITRLCVFFNFVCNKVLDVQQLDKLEEDIVVTLCLFEKYFPPSFFTIMIHLTVHIVREVKLCGPIYLRWMYPFERLMKVIKNSVRNRYRPEGCIAESYLIEEAVEFYTDFLFGVDSIGLGTRKSQDHLDTSNIGSPWEFPFKPQQKLLHQAHQYVSTELEVGNVGVSDNLRWIAHGPHPFVIRYSGYAINGCRYHTQSCDKERSVQNSGVSLVAKTMQVSSSKDKNLVIEDIGVQIDELSYVLVDLNRVGHKSDSFILASQAKQVFYVEDPSDVRWSVVLTPPQRDFEDRYNNDELGDTILQCEGIPNGMPDVDLNNDLDDNILTYVRAYCECTWIPT